MPRLGYSQDLVLLWPRAKGVLELLGLGVLWPCWTRTVSGSALAGLIVCPSAPLLPATRVTQRQPLAASFGQGLRPMWVFVVQRSLGRGCCASTLVGPGRQRWR